MKLTKSDREAFVAAVMNDVPKIDYDERAQKLATELLLESYPAAIQKVYADKELRTYLQNSYIGMPDCLSSFYGPSTESKSFYTDERLKAIAEEAQAQSQARRTLRESLTGIIGACSTLKQAQERLPEFEKYLPTDRGGSGLTNLPAISNVVAELTKAGWPKGQERARA